METSGPEPMTLRSAPVVKTTSAHPRVMGSRPIKVIFQTFPICVRVTPCVCALRSGPLRGPCTAQPFTHRAPVHTHTCAHTRAHTHTHRARTHAHTHTHTPCAHARAHTCAHTRIGSLRTGPRTPPGVHPRVVARKEGTGGCTHTPMVCVQRVHSFQSRHSSKRASHTRLLRSLLLLRGQHFAAGGA